LAAYCLANWAPWQPAQLGFIEGSTLLTDPGFTIDRIIRIIGIRRNGNSLKMIRRFIGFQGKLWMFGKVILCHATTKEILQIGGTMSETVIIMIFMISVVVRA